MRGDWGDLGDGRWEEGSCAGNERTGWGLVCHSFVLCQSKLILLKGIRYSCLYLTFLKNGLWKTKAAEDRSFCFFETKKLLIDRNKFIALMYSRELLDRHWLHESLSQSSFLAKDGNFLKHQCSAMAVEHLLNVSQAEFPNLLYGLWWRNIRGQEVSPATLRFSDKSWHHW